MPAHQPQLDGRKIMTQYYDLQGIIQNGFISYSGELFSRLTGDVSNVKADALSNATQMLAQLNTQKKTVESLMGQSPNADNVNAGTADFEIDSVSSALLKSIQVGCHQNHNLFKALLPQFPPQEPDFAILGNLVIRCIEDMIVLCAQIIEALER